MAKFRSKSLGSLGLVVAMALGSAGCIKSMILEGTIETTRKVGGSEAIGSLHDFEVAKTASMASLAQAEGFHYLAPDNEDALFLLLRGWTSAASGFIEDDMEIAELDEGEDSEAYGYHKHRAGAAYERAIFYGTELLEQMEPGFAAAQVNASTINDYLAAFDDPEHAEILLWLGVAWLGKTNIRKDEPEIVGQLFVGVALLKRSEQLDATFNNGIVNIALGAYHARAKMAELDESKAYFEKALQINGGNLLLTKVQYAARYHCMKGDRNEYVRLLEEVLAAGDVLPEARIQNVIARRKAERYIKPERMQKHCGF